MAFASLGFKLLISNLVGFLFLHVLAFMQVLSSKVSKLGSVNTIECFDDQHEVDKGEENDVEFF
jgi:hypothetical protein